MRERHRFMKGLFAWVGFPSRAVPYDRAPRAAGTTKWKYGRLWTLSLEGITSFTTLPLRVATWLGLGTAAAALLYGGWVVVKALLFGDPVPGCPQPDDRGAAARWRATRHPRRHRRIPWPHLQ